MYFWFLFSLSYPFWQIHCSVLFCYCCGRTTYLHTTLFSCVWTQTHAFIWHIDLSLFLIILRLYDILFSDGASVSWATNRKKYNTLNNERTFPRNITAWEKRYVYIFVYEIWWVDKEKKIQLNQIIKHWRWHGEFIVGASVSTFSKTWSHSTQRTINRIVLHSLLKHRFSWAQA